jgi:hypothetical protein
VGFNALLAALFAMVFDLKRQFKSFHFSPRLLHCKTSITPFVIFLFAALQNFIVAQNDYRTS